jgi:hypothetical protein
MRIADSLVLRKYFETPSKSGNYDFYRCYDCGSIITRRRERQVFNHMESDYYLRMCTCGSMKYSPGWPKFYEWLLPSVVRYTCELLLVRGLAAWADGRYPWLLPHIERVVRNEWEEPTWTTVTHIG